MPDEKKPETKVVEPKKTSAEVTEEAERRDREDPERKEQKLADAQLSGAALAEKQLQEESDEPTTVIHTPAPRENSESSNFAVSEPTTVAGPADILGDQEQADRQHKEDEKQRKAAKTEA